LGVSVLRKIEYEELTMTTSSDMHGQYDPFNLSRFLQAQERVYEEVLAELKAGQKRTHWIWYIFPQMEGLGYSSTSRHYAIKSEAEAREYLNHPILGSRLVECAQTVLDVKGRSALEIFGPPDDLKLRSSMTLFAQVSHPDSVFARVLDKYFHGKRDDKTLALLQQQRTKGHA
jgi:uncharacterized protein (DUF1810 family)